MTYLNQFLLCFIPIFVAINVLGLIPIYMSLTEELDRPEKRALLIQSSLTSFLVGFLFILLGQSVFKALGISEGDFRIGGGIVLGVISVLDLVSAKRMERRRVVASDQIGVVPIGIPLIMGPACLTTLLVLAKAHGYYMTVVSMIVNLLIVWLALRHSRLIAKVIGEGGAKALSKVASLLMAGIAVSLVRRGIEDLVN